MRGKAEDAPRCLEVQERGLEAVVVLIFLGTIGTHGYGV